MSQRGFVPILIVILLAIIVGSSVLIIKNIPFNQSEPASGVEQSSTSSAQVRVSPSPIVSKTPSPTLSSKKATLNLTTTSFNNKAANNSSGTANPTNTPTPTTGTLKGTIKDSNGNTLANAAFQITCNSCNNLRNGTTQDEQADGSGYFTVNNLPTITLFVKPFYSHWGDAKIVTIIGGQNTTVDLVVGADTAPKPTISITKGPYSSGIQAPCFDVSTSQSNCYQLNANYATDNGGFSTAYLTSGGACSYVGTICTNVTGSHIFKVKSYTISTNTYSDEVTSSYTYP